MQFFKITLSSVLATLVIGCIGNPEVSKVVVDESIPVVENLKSLTSLNQIGLEWTPIYSENVGGYYIYRGEGQAGKLKRIDTVKDRYASHYLDKNLKPGTLYTYKISAIGINGKESAVSESLAITTMPIPEPVPFIQAITNLPNRVKIIWRPHPFPNVTSYIIQRKKPTSSSWSNYANVDGRLSAEYIDKGLSDNKAYEYRVIAKTDSGILSHPSQVVNGITKPLPSIVKNLVASTNEPKKIILTWDASHDENVVAYNVYASPTSMFFYTHLAKVKETRFEDTLNENDKTKYYKVTAIDKYDLESLKQDEPVMGKTLPAPTAPIITFAEFNGQENVIRWSNGRNENMASYKIVKVYNDKKETINGIFDKNYVDTNILPETKYTYIIYAIDSHGLLSDGVKVDISTNINEAK